MLPGSSLTRKIKNPLYWLSGLLVVTVLSWWGFTLIRGTAPTTSDSIDNQLLQTTNRVTIVAGEEEVVEVPRYGIIDLTLNTTGSYENPYLQMPGDGFTPGFLVGTFNGPNSEVITIDGFWDGGDTWKIRTAATSVGEWEYMTSSSDPGLDGKSGSFLAVPSSHKGFLRINPDYPRTFMFDDGTPFLWMGATIGTFYLYPEKIDMRDGSFQEVHNTLALAGYNNYLFSSQILKKKSNFVENEGGFNFLHKDADQLNPSYWQWADLRLEYVNDKGIIPGILLGWPDQKIFSRFSDVQLKRAWRYAIARYSAYNIVWNLFGEIDEAGSEWMSIANDYGNVVQKFDPFDHLRTTHHTRSSSALADEPWYDFIEQQSQSIKLADADRSRYQMPVVNAESYYEGETGSAKDIRKFSWILMTHGVFFQYGKIRATEQSKGQLYNGILYDFYKDIEWWDLEPIQDLISGPGAHGHGSPGSEYVIYLENGGEVTVDLTAACGELNVKWYNPRTGEYSEQPTSSGRMQNTFTAQSSGDWVLHITQACD